MTRPTQLQKRLIHLFASAENISGAEAGERVGSSTSYANNVRRKYSEAISRLADWDAPNYCPIFGDPYKIQIPSAVQKQLHLYDGDIAELEFEVGTDTNIVYGEVVDIDESYFGWDSPEFHARITGCYQTGSGIKDSDCEIFEDLPIRSDGKLDFKTFNDVRGFFININDQLSSSLKSSPIMIGCGLLEIASDKRVAGNLISTPQFNLERNDFIDYLTGNPPELTNISLYDGEVGSPDEVYFTYYGQDLSTTELQKSARDQILEQQYYQSDWNYALPGFQSIVGPTTVAETTELIEISEESLSLIPGLKQEIAIGPSGGRETPPQLTAEDVEEAIENANPRFSNLATQNRYSDESKALPTRIDNGSLVLIFDQVTVAITVDDDQLVWEYPSEIDNVIEIKKGINNIISDQLDLNLDKSDPETPNSPRVTQDNWVIDTNVLYHDHTGNEPTSIVHSIFSHRFLYDSTIHLPWVVLYELNKHPDRGSASKSVNEQGFENLKSLNLLDEIEFLSVDYQRFPDDITTDVGLGDIADFYILKYAEEIDAHLISGDQSLLEITNATDIFSLNIGHLSTSSSPSEDDKVKSDVIEQIGIKFDGHSEILSEIEHRSGSESVANPSESSHQLSDEPDEILSSYLDGETIISHAPPGNSELQYAQAHPIRIVLSASVAEFIDEYIRNFDGEKYLGTNLLREVRSQTVEMRAQELPYIDFIVPTEYVTLNMDDSDGPSDFNRNLLQLQHTINSDYTPRSAMQSESVINNLPDTRDTGTDPIWSDGNATIGLQDYLGIGIASELDYGSILLPDPDENLQMYPKLLGCRVFTLSKPDD